MPVASFVDPAAMLDSLDRRVYTLEQLLSSVDGPWSSTDFSSINIIPTDPEAQPLHVSMESDPATGLALTWSSFFDNIYADVSWVAPVSATAQTYTVEWAKKIAGVYQLVNAQGGIVGDTLRVERLDPNTTYGFRVYGVNPIGIPSVPIPATGFLDVAVGQDSTQPAAPTGVSVAQAIRGLMVRWNQNSEFDVANGKGMYKVELSSNAAFTAIVKTDFTSATVWSTSDLTPGVQYWARVYAIDQGGNMSGPSTVATDSTEYVINNYIADFAVTNAKIADLTIDDGKVLRLSADKVTFGTMSGDRIAANSAQIGILTTSSLTTQTITLAGGSMIAGTPGSGSGILFNSQGIRAYTAGVLTFTLDVTGTISLIGNINSGSNISGATISGGTITGPTIQTAATGRRAALGPTIIGGSGVQMYSGAATESNYAQIGVNPYTLGGNRNQLIISSGQHNGQSPASIELYGAASDGVSSPSSMTLTAAQYTFAGGGNDVLFNVGGTVRINSSATITGDFLSDLQLSDTVIYFRPYPDNNHGLFWTDTDQPTPSIGYQVMDGPLLYGYISVGLSAANVLGLRIFNNNVPANRRCDTYFPLYYVSSQSFSSIKTKVRSSVRALDVNYSDQLMQLRPVRFQSIGIDRIRFGLIAEEVVQHLPDVVWPGHGPDDVELPAIEYDGLTALLILEAQNQRKRIQALEASVTALQALAAPPTAPL